MSFLETSQTPEEFFSFVLTLDRDGPRMSNVMRLDGLPGVGSSTAGGFQC